MAWDKGRYYTRSRKVNGRVDREYVGTGWLAELAAQVDALEGQRRQEEQARLEALDAPLSDLNDRADLLARAALLAAGYHQHNRGEWRRRREQDCPTPEVSARRASAAGRRRGAGRRRRAGGPNPGRRPGQGLRG
jgi:hypothetical protein